MIDTQFQGDYATLLSWIKHVETLPFFIQVHKIDLKPHPKEEMFKENFPSPPLVADITIKVILK